MRISPVCMDCATPLTDENWYPSSRRTGYYICKGCSYKRNRDWLEGNRGNWREWHKEYMRDWRQRKRELQREYTRRYFRKHALVTTINGKQVVLCGLHKRPRPLGCELCGRNGFLTHHHWDIKDKVVYGIWICRRCHAFVERYEKGFLERYLKLREQVKFEIERR